MLCNSCSSQEGSKEEAKTAREVGATASQRPSAFAAASKNQSLHLPNCPHSLCRLEDCQVPLLTRPLEICRIAKLWRQVKRQWQEKRSFGSFSFSEGTALFGQEPQFIYGVAGSSQHLDNALSRGNYVNGNGWDDVAQSRSQSTWPRIELSR